MIEAGKDGKGVEVKLNQIDKLTRVKHHQIDFPPSAFLHSLIASLAALNECSIGTVCMQEISR